jgi:integral membrane protein
MLNSAVGRVRLAGMVEGTSFLLLLFIAMPLKYLAHIPEPVLAVGWVHGVLFIIYAAVTFIAWGGGHITARMVGMAAVASLVPFGPFVIDRRMKVAERFDETRPEEAAHTR